MRSPSFSLLFSLGFVGFTTVACQAGLTDGHGGNGGSNSGSTGNTGNTGRSFCAHTHVEVLLNGTTPTDPIVWLREYTDGSHEVG